MSNEEPHKRKYVDVDKSEENTREAKRHRSNNDATPVEVVNLLHSLPPEIRQCIFSYLNWKDAVRLQVVSSVWFQETVPAIEELYFFSPHDLDYAQNISSLIPRCKNINSFAQIEGNSFYGHNNYVLLLNNAQLNRLSSLSIKLKTNSDDLTRMVSQLTSLVNLSLVEDGFEASRITTFISSFSLSSLTKMTIDTRYHIHESALSTLTGLKDFTLKHSTNITLPLLPPLLRRLDLYECSNLHGMDLAKFPFLESLTVQKSELGFMIENIEQCKKLTQLRPDFMAATTVLPIDKMTQLRELDIVIKPSPIGNEMKKLLPLNNLTKLTVTCAAHGTGLSVLRKLTQLKILILKSHVKEYLYIVNNLHKILPNLESLLLQGWMMPQSAENNISAMQHLTSLSIECPNCSPQNPCHIVLGIEKLTNLEILSMKLCSFTPLSNLTRLRSLTVRASCMRQPISTGDFIDHVADVPNLALEKFQITGVHSRGVHDNITRLIVQQTSLRELYVGHTPYNGVTNYHTSTLMSFKHAIQEYEDELKEKERQNEDWANDDNFDLGL